MREHRAAKGTAKGKKGNEKRRRNERRRSTSTSFIVAGKPTPPRGTLQVFTPPFSSEPQRARPELDAMVARGKCLNFSLSKISR